MTVDITAPRSAVRRLRISGRQALDAAAAPQSVAVIGASSNPLKLGHLVLKTLINSGYPGRIYAINPTATSVLGVVTHPSLVSVDGPVDVAVVIVPASQLMATLQECAATQVSLVVAITSGFAEAGNDGQQLQQEPRSLPQNGSVSFART